MKTSPVLILSCWLVVALLPLAALPASPPAPSRLETVSIRCEVVSATGEPVKDAKVYVTSAPGREHFLDDSIVAQGTTDAEGRFHHTYSPPAHWEIFYGVVIVDGGSQGIGFGTVYQQPLMPAPDNVRIQLQPASELKATILTPEGGPAAGLDIWVSSFGLAVVPEDWRSHFVGEVPRLPGNLWKARTDAQGRCAIPQLPKGATLWLRHTDPRWAHLPGRYTLSTSSNPRADAKETTLRLQTAGSIRGKILLPDGRPAPRSIVSIIEAVSPYVTAHGDEVLTQDNGEFIIDQIPPSTYRLHFDTQPPHFDRWIGADKEAIVVQAGKATEVGDLIATEAAHVTGEVVDAETGKAIAEPFIFRLAAGKHTLNYRSMRHRAPEYLPPSADDVLRVEVAEGDRKTVTFKLLRIRPDDRVMGMVIDENGRPVANARVIMKGYDGIPFPSETTTDKTGEFMLIRQKGASQEAVFAYHDKAMSNVVPVAAGQTVTLQIRDSGWGKVVGTVVNESGKPVAGAEIGWYLPEPVTRWAPVAHSAKSNAEGRFEFPRFWDREESAHFYCKAEGFGTDSLRHQTIRKGIATDLKFVLKKADRKVSGVVVDSSGKPVKDLWVKAGGDDQTGNAKGRTDETGTFRIEGLVSGMVHLNAKLETEARTTEVTRWVDAGTLDVKLVLPEASGEVSGILVNAEGAAVPMAEVDAYSRGRATTTDQQGRFKLGGLLQGWFTVRAKAPNAKGEIMETQLRLKTGMTDVTITLPASLPEEKVRPVDPVNLLGRPAAPLNIATWVNVDPLPPHGQGKVRILDFWGMECGPCLASFPKVQEFWESHRDKGIEIVALTGFYPEQEVKEFLAKHPTYRFPVALQAANSTASFDYDVRSIPTYVVIDQKGMIVSKGHSFDDAGKVALELLRK